MIRQFGRLGRRRLERLMIAAVAVPREVEPQRGFVVLPLLAESIR